MRKYRPDKQRVHQDKISLFSSATHKRYKVFNFQKSAKCAPSLNNNLAALTRFFDRTKLPHYLQLQR